MTRALAMAVLGGLLWLAPVFPAHADPPARERCSEPATAAAAAPVDLNTATEAELLNLPGIGPARAQAILAFREAHGGFTSVSQLLRIKGFGRAMLKRLRPLVTVSPVPPAA